MKRLLFIILLLPAMLHAQVQKYILVTGTNGYVTVIYPKPAGDSMPQDYTRGLLMASFYKTPKGDTQLSIMQTDGLKVSTLIPYTVDTNFQNGDASNSNFPTTDSIYKWVRKHFNKYVGN